MDEIMEEKYAIVFAHSSYAFLLAGAAAGLMEHCVMYPFDAVKTRMQSLRFMARRGYVTPFKVLGDMIRREGLFRPLRGISAIVTGAVPAHALYFTVYENVKFRLTKGRSAPSYVYGAAGAMAALVHDAVMNPAEVIKQRMQMCGSPYLSCVHCARCVLHAEGMFAFYRSYLTQLLMNVPFHSTQFAVYELTQDYLNPEHVYTPSMHVLSGAVSGGVAVAVTMPFDVCKTALNTQDMRLAAMHCPHTLRGIKDALRVVYRSKGVRGFYSGMQARLLFQMPGTAITWSVYELFKFVLTSGLCGTT